MDPVNPVRVIDGAATPRNGFNSLVDAAVAVDPTNEHLLVSTICSPAMNTPKRSLTSLPPPAPTGQACGPHRR